MLGKKAELLLFGGSSWTWQIRMSQSVQIESAVIHGWIEAYYDDNITVTACTHDGSAVSAVLQDDNVIGKQEVKTGEMVLACVCVSVEDICRATVGCPFTVPQCLAYI